MNNKNPEYAITVVNTESGTCLTTKKFDDRRAVKAAFEESKGSAGPFATDELLEYLEGEYGHNAPFGLWDVHGLSGRANAYMWSALESPPEGHGLKLGTTDGDSLRLAVTGY